MSTSSILHSPVGLYDLKLESHLSRQGPSIFPSPPQDLLASPSGPSSSLSLAMDALADPQATRRQGAADPDAAPSLQVGTLARQGGASEGREQ